jgi:hypothetical protein
LKIKFNTDSSVVVAKMKSTILLDIETSLVEVRLFSLGQQFVNANQLKSQTRILTVAGGSLYDLATKGEAGVWAYGNHQFPAFNNDPLDDSHTLQKVWDKLDQATTVVCHNAKFDQGWLNGRFLQLGWPLPRPYKLVCTYRGLTGFNMNSKKLDVLSNTLIGTAKIKTDWTLWDRCSDGEKDAFDEMMKYNIGDIYNTLYQVYVRTAAYYPSRCVNLAIPGVPSCRVSGHLLSLCGTVENEANGKEHNLYINATLNIYYKERCHNESKKAGQGRLIPMK